MKRCSNILLLLVTAWSLGCARARPTPATTQDAPTLAVLLVIDGLRYRDLEAARDQLGEGGLRRLVDGGAVFEAARYPYATTQTCPGHASLATGTLPRQHGIIANSWYARGEKTRCIDDADSPTFGDPERTTASPALLLAPTLGDELVARGNARVLGLSLKDRAAVMLAGHRGTAVYWGTTGFTTSRYYAAALPAWVARWNAARAARPDRWERLPARAPAGADDDPRERPSAGLGRTFPHPIGSDDALIQTPYGIDMLLDLALAGVRANALGKRPHARDLLAISISTVDLVSHGFGPDSHEAFDTLLRLDRALARFFADLDREVGLSRTVIAFTADHGMTAIPATPSGRVESEEVTRAADAVFDGLYGDDTWIAAFTPPHLYLDRAALARHDLDVETAAAAGAAALARSTRWQAVLTASEAHSGDGAPGGKGAAADTLRGAVARASHAERMGDLVIVPADGTLLGPDADSASFHGGPHETDVHVPLIVYGRGIRAARHARPVSPLDVAPTLARWLGVSMPSAAGTALPEALPRAP